MKVSDLNKSEVDALLKLAANMKVAPTPQVGDFYFPIGPSVGLRFSDGQQNHVNAFCQTQSPHSGVFRSRVGCLELPTCLIVLIVFSE